MASVQFQVKQEHVLQIIKELTTEEQELLLSQLKSLLKKSPKKKTPRKQAEKKEGIYKGFDGLPSMESLEEIREKYALKTAYLEPLKELFKDAPPAEDMIKMLTR